MKKNYAFITLLLMGTFWANAQITTFTVTVPSGTQGVRMTGPWWGWNPLGGPVAVNNGNNTFTVTLFDGAPQAEMEYLWVITTADGSATAGTGQENLIDNAAGGQCTGRINSGTLITDYFSYANRIYKVGPTASYEIYDDCFPASSTPLGINDYEIVGLNTYPNPTTNKWTISTKDQKIEKIEIFNTIGKKVVSLKPNTTAVDVDASKLPYGIYMATITTKLGTNSRKLIKN